MSNEQTARSTWKRKARLGFVPFCWKAWCLLWCSEDGCLHPHRWTCGCLGCYGPVDGNRNTQVPSQRAWWMHPLEWVCSGLLQYLMYCGDEYQVAVLCVWACILSCLYTLECVCVYVCQIISRAFPWHNMECQGECVQKQYINMLIQHFKCAPVVHCEYNHDSASVFHPDTERSGRETSF